MEGAGTVTGILSRLGGTLLPHAFVPYTDRFRPLLLPPFPAFERAYGLLVCSAIKGRRAILPATDPRVQWVERIGRRLALAAADAPAPPGLFRGPEAAPPLARRPRVPSEHMRRQLCEFFVIDDPIPYAGILPGGVYIIHTGLLLILDGSDHLLAMILAHEMGHCLARHSAERLSIDLSAAAAAWAFWSVSLSRAADVSTVLPTTLAWLAASTAFRVCFQYPVYRTQEVTLPPPPPPPFDLCVCTQSSARSSACVRGLPLAVGSLPPSIFMRACVDKL